MTEPKHFLIMAGGTGGHVFPGLAVANALRDQGHKVSWLGTRAGIESDVVPAAGIEIHYIDIEGVRGKGKAGLLKAPFKIWYAIRQSLAVMNTVKPDCVIGMGGFASGPGGIAAKLKGIPLVIHEQNAIAGTTNRILAHFANEVLEAFPGTFKKSVGAIHVGNPVRRSMHQASRGLDDEQDLRLLVLGGSLGAKAINEIIPKVLDELNFTIEIWHQTGKKHFADVEALYGEETLSMKAIDLMPFIDDMAEAYDWADIVICRAGAMTVSELAVAGLPAIFIPFPYAIDDHQTANAKWMVDAGAAVLLPEAEMTVGRIKFYLDKFNKKRHELKAMRAKAAALGIHEATDNVTRICVEAAL